MSMIATYARTFAGAAAAMLLGGTCLIAAAGPAVAAPVDARQTKVVRYADLNLANEYGRATLAARVRGAAREVCRNDGIGIAARSAEAQCVADAVKAASAATGVTLS